MLNNNVTTLIWMLIFFVVFYLYIDVRMTNLRNELLRHYTLCESLLSKGTGSQSPRSPTEELPYVTSIMPPMQHVDHFTQTNVNNDSINSMIPTREEVASGLNSLNEARCSNGNAENLWYSNASSLSSGYNAAVLDPYDVSGEGLYAPFGSPA